MGDDVYPIPAMAFYAVEGIVSHPAQQFRAYWVLGGPDRRSNAHSNGERSAWRIKWYVADRRPKAFGALLQRVQVAIGSHDQEFFSPHAPNMIVTTGGFTETLRGFSKDDISNRVSVGIVDSLEVIEVSDENSHVVTASFSPWQLLC